MTHIPQNELVGTQSTATAPLPRQGSSYPFDDTGWAAVRVVHSAGQELNLNHISNAIDACNKAWQRIKDREPHAALSESLKQRYIEMMGQAITMLHEAYHVLKACENAIIS